MADLGKLFLVEPSGPRLSASEKAALAELRPSAIMFRKRNFLQDLEYEAWLETYADLLSGCRQAAGRDKLLVCLDHEGGKVVRPPVPVTRFPYAARWADRAYEVGTAMGAELRSLGVNVNFAPVADIHLNESNPVISERSFGRTPQVVSSACLEFTRGLESQGVLACAKHFPGHGATSTDSHFGLPVLDLTLDELRNRELVPFRRLIAGGIKLVMTAHILFPSIDARHPATLSGTILQDVLRKEMGFAGVTISDALGMKAVSGIVSDTEELARALEAGVDLFLVGGDNVELTDACEMARSLARSVAKGLIRPERVAEASARIDSLLEVAPDHQVCAIDPSALEKHRELAAFLAERSPWPEFELNLPGFE